MTIDENTGLPQLPEGYFWRVQEGKDAIMRGPFWSGWQPEYMVPYGRKTERRTRNYTEEGFFRTKTIVVKEARVLSETEVESETYKGWVRTPGGEKEFRAGDPTTPENVVIRCTEVLKKWESKKARREIYDDYPPKKLES